jgi:SAM-dependent methyltransferase
MPKLRRVLHDRAARGFADVAGPYERGRPGYPAALGALLRDEFQIGPGRRVLDLGAGTGKLTRVLLDTGADVLAAEPLPNMRAALAGLLEDGAILDAAAERLPLPAAGLDAALSGDAWHWFDGERALDELSRVLRPGAPLVTVWHRSLPAPWERALHELLASIRPEHPYFTGRALDAFAGHPGFDALEHRELTHEHPTDPEGVLAGLASISFVAALAPAERDALLAQAASAVEQAPRPIVQRFAVDVWITRRRRD